MSLERETLVASLLYYKTPFAEEQPFVKQFLELLEHPDAFQRYHLPGHITGSSWIVDPSREFVLLVHHETLNRWLQPGGHADGEEDVLNVALREAREETGVTNFKVLQNTFFDLDIHPIPATTKFPEHLHYDIRFLIQADRSEKIIVSEESHDVSWMHVDHLEQLTDNNASVMRMLQKIRMPKA